MNLAPYEEALLRALRAGLAGEIDWQAGPAVRGPATGVRAQVFVHAAVFADAGGITADGARAVRQPVTLDGGVIGFAEQRPGVIDIEVSCLCGQPADAQQLAGRVVPVLLDALETLPSPLLGDPADHTRQLRFVDCRAHLRGQGSQRLLHEGVAATEVVSTLRLEGLLHVLLTRPGGLVKHDSVPLRLEIQADPAGQDLQAEHVLLHNASDLAIELGGWTLHDAARSTHVYTFATGRPLAAGATLRLWSGRGSDDADNLHWGRRQAVWNNTGDVAVLRDAAGAERARATWQPPLPAPPAVAPRLHRRR
ncbi:MAG: lamin tail domain-containing protein [Polaromonas sp.]|nr:lamin tail domain-containing protein [Polaromonas sp.]